MKIVQIGAGIPPNTGGVGSVIRNLSIIEAKKGHELHVILKGKPTESVYSNNNIFEHYIKRRKNRVINTIFYNIETFKILKQIKPDVIHLHSIDDSIPVVLTRYLYKFPYILTLHATWHGCYLYPKELRKIWKCFPWLRVPNHVTALTKNRYAELLPYRNKNISVVENGVATEIFTPKDVLDSRSDAPKILCVSRLTARKGLEDAIDAMKNIVQKYPNAKLQVLGEGLYRKELETRISSLSLDRNVELVGFISVPDIVKYYHNADVYLLPSLDEGLPLVSLEAMSCGLPLISTDVSILPEILSTYKNGYLVPMQNPDIIAQRVIELHNLDTKQYTALCENSIKASKRFQWDKIVDSYLSIYHKIME